MTIRYRKTISILAAAGLAMTSMTAAALPFFPSNGYEPGTLFEDNDLDWHVDNNQNGIIDNGDYLISVMEFGHAVDNLIPIDPASPIPLDTAGDELVAVAKIMMQDDPSTPLQIEFAPIDATTPMVAAYNLGSSINLDIGTYSNCHDMSSCIDAVIDGTLYAEFSIADPDDEWFFIPSSPAWNNPSIVANADTTSKVGTVNFALSQVGGAVNLGLLSLDCGFVIACAGDGLTNLRGSADILGGGGTSGPYGATGAFATSDTDVSIIPEPGLAALIGMGLFGFGMSRRRKGGIAAP